MPKGDLDLCQSERKRISCSIKKTHHTFDCCPIFVAVLASQTWGQIFGHPVFDHLTLKLKQKKENV